MILRRNFLTGLASLLASPAIVQAQNIMPVRTVILTPPDPIVSGVRWQTWPLGTPQPEFFATGSIGVEFRKVTRRPLSHWLEQLEKYKTIYPELQWTAVE